jgi:asparagine synthase (glutamine-hydrolysing)
MCGIAGVIGAIDASLEAAVEKMMSAESHRGPDDSGLYRSGGSAGVVLGFRRLAIMDLTSDGHQPMEDHETGNVVAFNGEIYNFSELRSDLERNGVRFRSRGDTEVLLRGYGRLGADILPRLRGMYGFAIYDARRREVLIARDRLGIKPLYYATLERPSGRVILFASELRALLATGLFERRLDREGLASYLWNGFVCGPNTLVQGISLLPPGAAMRIKVDAPEATPERYWSLKANTKLNAEEGVEQLRTELETATRQHLVSDVPLGVFLSGGVDSSAIASLAVRAAQGKVKTFHIGFEEAKFDESGFARQIAGWLGTEHVELRLTQDHFRGGLEDALGSLDQPTFDAINSYFVSKLVREAGVTVALAGTGGDELFGGYRSFRDLPLGQRLARVTGQAPSAVIGSISKLFAGSSGVPPQTRWGKLADLFNTRGESVNMYQVAYALYTRDFLHELAADSLVDCAPYGLVPERARELAALVDHASPLAAIGTLELALFIGERLLRDTDAASMAVSLEVRVPLLDHKVVEAAQALPDDVRFAPLGKKQLLKELTMPDLDLSIFDRPKAGFVLPIEVWAKDRLAADIQELFSDRGLVESVGFNPDALGSLFRAFQSGAPGIYWSRIWAPFVLMHWCQEHGVAL